MTTYTITETGLSPQARMDLDAGDPIDARLTGASAQEAYNALKYLCEPTTASERRNTMSDVLAGAVLLPDTVQAAMHAVNPRPATGAPLPECTWRVTSCTNIRDVALAEIHISVTPVV